MTFEELKSEAKAQGYNLIKIQKEEKLLPCTCGCNRRNHWYNYWDSSVGLECMRCGKKIWGESERDARRKWNEMVRK